MLSVEENNRDGPEESELRDFTAQTSGLMFWNDVREEVYQDFLLKAGK